MALQVGASQPLVNGTASPTPAETDALYDELLRIRDAVVAGSHASIKLPPSAIEQLKARLLVPNALVNGTSPPRLNGDGDGPAFPANQAQPATSPTFAGLPGLQASAGYFSGTTQSHVAKASAAASLDPIFLEKSDSLVRAEGQLKRQRLDRELQAQVDQRKHSARDKDPVADAPSPINVDAVLKSALDLVKPVSGLEAEDAASSSFDENDYYSSQVQSDWSSDASSNDGSDRAAGAFTADFERLDGAHPPSASRGKQPAHLRDAVAAGPSHAQAYQYVDEDDDMYEPEDEDDDYTPPDPSAYDITQGIHAGTQQMDVQDDDDNSDYEPGEVVPDSDIPTPDARAPHPAQLSQHVHVIRNHLTHIAAPQPNRVSPLATAKGPSYDLELVNGSPQVVRKPQTYQSYGPSRVSTASPSGNGANGSGKKRKNKKRKRDQEPTGRAKRRRERQSVLDSAGSPTPQEPYIKNEPISPPPFANAPDYTPYSRAVVQQPEQAYIGETRTRPRQSNAEPLRSGLRYEYAQPTAQPAAPSVVRVSSPSSHRSVQRDTQDLRRVASLHYAQRPPSPPKPGPYSPVAPYRKRTTSMTYGDPHYTQQIEHLEQPTFAEQTGVAPVQYARTARSRSPPRLQEYRDAYAEPAPASILMPPPPPAAPLRRIIVDQYGNQYMEAEPAPAYVPRASIAPAEIRSQPEVAYERAPSRMSTSYAQQPPSAGRYEPVDSRTAPPPSTRRPVSEQQFDYVDANGFSIREYMSRAAPEPSRYAPEPTSPVYQPARAYEQMPPPAAPLAREPTSPTYAPLRSYSVRPEEAPRVQSSYVRQGSVAPVQYVRQEPAPLPARAASVMPGLDYGSAAQAPPQRTYSQAPHSQTVRYVDQHGNEVFPRQVSELRYQ